ncbi:hypothetical protein B0H19DRAFT_1249582 [Mycena capillaripes]|nr:hypothetical protein B0H19DRAFT_1249582 [Mycena capillaripes]
MPGASLSVRTILLEQVEKIGGSSKAQIQLFIDDSESKIVSLESRIVAEEFQTAIDLLIEQRERERATVAVLRYLAAPIYTLPVELLAEIFVLAVSIITDDDSRRSLHIKDAFRISHVCADWRQIANSTPRLWTGPITVDFWKSGRLEGAYVEGLRAWFVRSAPLAVPVSFIHLRSGMRFDISPRITDEVVSISHRWRSLRVTQKAPASFIGRLAEGRLDNLEDLELGDVVDDWSVDAATIGSFLTGAPRLRNLRMHLACQISMPWTQLTELILTNGDSADVSLRILAQCPALINASVETAGWYELPTAQANIVALDLLTSLSLILLADEVISKHFGPFLDRLSAPALDNLCVDFSGGRVVLWTEAQFTAFQQRSPNITQLELRWAELTSDDLSAALRHAPALTHLSLNHCPNCMDDALLRALHYKDGLDLPLVPRLHSLVLEDMERNTFTEDILVGTIASRWWTDAEMASRSAPPAVARWTHVELRTEFSQHFEDVVEDLRHTGLIVELVKI